MKLKTSTALVFAITCLLSSAVRCHAAFIVGGTGFVTQTYADQLETWLGEGPITITSVFTKLPGHTAEHFHNASDGKGRTFSIIEVLSGNNFYNSSQLLSPQVIGGYNPQSWSSIGDWNYTTDLVDRTGFIFNLTATEKQNQNQDDSGLFQTYNAYTYGPLFGGGQIFMWTTPSPPGSLITIRTVELPRLIIQSLRAQTAIGTPLLQSAASKSIQSPTASRPSPNPPQLPSGASVPSAWA
jgi:hypothetical protein